MRKRLRLANQITKIILLACIPWGTSSVAFADESNWEQISDKDGIVSYTKQIGEDGVVHIRGVAKIMATVDAIVTVLKDNDSADKWMPMVRRRNELKSFSPDHRIEYTQLRMPWPITDRYFVADETVVAMPNGGAKITMESLQKPDAAWLHPDLVMAFFHTSQFLLTPAADKKGTDFDFELHSDTGGFVPKWLVKMGQKNWPRDLVGGIKRQLEQRGTLDKLPNP